MGDQYTGELHWQGVAPAPQWTKLRVAAEIYADYQQFRIASSNRTKNDKLPSGVFLDLMNALEFQETALAKTLREIYREAVPQSIRKWQKETVGLGEHTFARLLGLLGPPRIAFPYHWEGEGKDSRHLVADEPYERQVSQLWSYCGVGDASRKRRKGMTEEDAAACGSPRLRALMFVIAEGCIKHAHSLYRQVYDEARQIYVDRVDAEGKPWTLAHQHAAGLRRVAKEILRDLWLAAGEDEANNAPIPSPCAPVLFAASRLVG